MKYLKKYNESLMSKDEVNEIIDTIEDIFADIKDDGFVIEYTKDEFQELGYLNLSISKPKTIQVGSRHPLSLGNMPTKFKLTDVSNTVEHLYNYLVSIDKLRFLKISTVISGLSYNLPIDRLKSLDNYLADFPIHNDGRKYPYELIERVYMIFTEQSLKTDGMG